MTNKKSKKRILYKEVKSGLKSLKANRTKKCDCAKSDIQLKIVLDRSGSMDACKREVIGGFNEYISKLKEDNKSNYTVTLVRFDTEFETVYKDLPIKNVPDLDALTFSPRGLTALNDALGKTINESGKTPKDTKVLMVVFTDGAENASKEFTVDQVRSLVESRKADGNWTVVYIGSDLNAQKHATSYGTPASNFMPYTNNGVGVRSAMGTLAQASITFSSNASQGKAVMDGFFTEGDPDPNVVTGTVVTPTLTGKA